MHARLIWRLPAAWGLYYSCLDRELSLKALERSQAPGETAVELRGAWIIRKKERGRGREKNRDPALPVYWFHRDRIRICIKIKKP